MQKRKPGNLEVPASWLGVGGYGRKAEMLKTEMRGYPRNLRWNFHLIAPWRLCVKFTSCNLKNLTRLRPATAWQEVETLKLEV